MIFLVLTDYNGWGRGQPNNNFYSQLIPFQSCLALDFTVTGRQRGWNDESCAEYIFQAGNSVNGNYGHICAYGKLKGKAQNDKQTVRPSQNSGVVFIMVSHGVR